MGWGGVGWGGVGWGGRQMEADPLLWTRRPMSRVGGWGGGVREPLEFMRMGGARVCVGGGRELGRKASVNMPLPRRRRAAVEVVCAVARELRLAPRAVARRRRPI